jgi:SAM-dependent methyltransferase
LDIRKRGGEKMLRFVTKRELWEAEASGIDAIVKGKAPYHLKSIQDAVCLSRIGEVSEKSIAEIGGGDSRLLRHFARGNRCVNVDRFEGQGKGPSNEIRISGVRNVRAFMGEFSPELRENEFDITFSISVIEHVPNDMVAKFFEDVRRITRTGGLTIHLIDMYIADEQDANVLAMERLKLYRDVFASGLFRPDDSAAIVDRVQFSCAYATNPDNVMRLWNRMVPELTEVRRRSQSCSLILVGHKD